MISPGATVRLNFPAAGGLARDLQVNGDLLHQIFRDLAGGFLLSRIVAVGVGFLTWLETIASATPMVPRKSSAQSGSTPAPGLPDKPSIVVLPL